VLKLHPQNYLTCEHQKICSLDIFITIKLRDV